MAECGTLLQGKCDAPLQTLEEIAKVLNDSSTVIEDDLAGMVFVYGIDLKVSSDKVHVLYLSTQQVWTIEEYNESKHKIFDNDIYPYPFPKLGGDSIVTTTIRHTNHWVRKIFDDGYGDGDGDGDGEKKMVRTLLDFFVWHSKRNTINGSSIITPKKQESRKRKYSSEESGGDDVVWDMNYVDSADFVYDLENIFNF